MMDALMGPIDPVLIKEELGDMSWYVVNYATIRKISISQQTDVGHFGLQSYVYYASKLTDIMKKWMIYNKEFTPQGRKEEEEIVQKLVDCICNFAYDDKKVDINEAWEMNINKLHKGRYKNAVYSDDAANNRNLEEERNKLEGK